ncbi:MULTISPECIES: hypothetical protein [Paenibacillus]|uniref:hypothetical protein n=1 Tax=Paenibacillus TaxID=44249 RepID=UPI00096F69A3|nr:hypothetical protein [Paenibacillus odorifer]OME12875.1 hypothetical protein BSK60_17400 [Paenibacillus odorifer]
MAINLLFVQCAYTTVFIIALYLMKQKQLNFVTQKDVLTIVYVIIGFGLLNWIGSWKFAGGLVGWFSNTVIKENIRILLCQTQMTYV